MRDYEPYRSLGRTDFGNRWIRSEEQANLLLLTSYSTSGRNMTWANSARFAHNYDITAYETFWVDMPWGSGSSNNTIIYANKLVGPLMIYMGIGYILNGLMDLTLMYRMKDVLMNKSGAIPAEPVDNDEDDDTSIK